MSQNYLFPCTNCDHSIEISGRDAGRQLKCAQCNTELVAPTLRGIKELEAVGQDPAKPGKQPARDKRPFGMKSWLFSGGLLLTVLAGAAGLGLWQYASGLETTVDVNKRVADANERVETAEPAELWDAWYIMMENGALPEWNENSAQRYNKQAGYLKTISYGILGIAGLGLLSVIGSFVMKN